MRRESLFEHQYGRSSKEQIRTQSRLGTNQSCDHAVAGNYGVALVCYHVHVVKAPTLGTNPEAGERVAVAPHGFDRRHFEYREVPDKGRPPPLVEREH
jgi:hypothetical protein